MPLKPYSANWSIFWRGGVAVDWLLRVLHSGDAAIAAHLFVLS